MTDEVHRIPELVVGHPANLSSEERGMFFRFAARGLTGNQLAVAMVYLPLAQQLVTILPNSIFRDNALRCLLSSRDQVLAAIGHLDKGAQLCSSGQLPGPPPEPPSPWPPQGPLPPPPLQTEEYRYSPPPSVLE